MGPRVREDNGRWDEDGFPRPRGQGRWTKMGSRLRVGIKGGEGWVSAFGDLCITASERPHWEE